MNWKQAVEYMEQGGKVTRKSWFKHDYLYMDDGVLYDDCDNQFLGRLTTRGNWEKYNEV